MPINIPKQHGMTLIELLIISAIMTTTSVLGTQAYAGYIKAANISVATHQIHSLSFIINAYFENNNDYPANLQQIQNQNFLDPWGNTYSYLRLSDARIGQARKDGNNVPINTYYDLYSSGENGESRTPLRAQVSHDDVIYASDGKYVGIADEF